MKTQTLDRVFELNRAGIDEETRMVPASLSSETPVIRSGFGERYNEILAHGPDNIDTERADRGLPLLFNHDDSVFIGKARNFRIGEDKRTHADLYFSSNARATEVWNDVTAGLIQDISLRYRVNDYDDSDFPDVVITRWTPLEASVVPVPADPSVGINRKLSEEKEMENTETQKGKSAEGSGVDVIKLSEAARRKERQEGMKLEAERRDGIDDVFADFLTLDGAEEIRSDCLTGGKTVEQARGELLRFLGSRSEPVSRPMSDSQRRHSATVVSDAADKWKDGITGALMVRYGIEQDAEKVDAIRSGNEFMSYSLIEMARDYLRRVGEDMRGMSPVQIAGKSLQRSGVISHSSSDFTDVLANVASKALTLGYTQAPETWRPFCRIGSLSDYKQAKRVSLTSFSDLDRIRENGEYPHGTTGDLAENIIMRKYGKLFSISREAILNDDADAFSRLPRMMGAAAARIPGDLVYTEILLGNPTLNQDSTALFAAGHSNLVAAGSGAAPSVATLNTAFAAMRTQTDPDANSTLNVQPQYLIVPAALEGTALTLTTSMYQDTAPGVTSGVTISNGSNRFTNLTVIVEPRIDANDAAKWFLAANPNSGVIDTIEVAFLNGQETPYMEQQDGFSQDGVTYKVRLEVTAAPIAYQGLYHNDGN